MLTIKEVLNRAVHDLQKVSIKSASLDARILLQFILDKPHEYLVLNKQQILAPEIIDQFNSLLVRRINFQPIAYIIGVKEFYGREFLVNKDVLIPRSDTEILIDVVKNQTSNIEPLKILDLGSGSGCIIITLMLELNHASGIAVDISDDALKLLKKNVIKYGLENRLDLIQSNWFDNLNNNEKFDLIISNPPYIDQNEINLISREVLRYEPNVALFAEEHGLANYYIIALNARKYLQCDGKIFVEIGFNQVAKVKSIFEKNKYIHLGTYQDISGNDRVMVFKS